MATGISECKKCGKEFKWSRNKEQGPAKYCSKVCKDNDHANWCRKTSRQTLFICEDCGKQFKRYTVIGSKPPRFCSKECMNKNVHSWCKKDRFFWDETTEEEKLERLKMNFEKHVIKKDGCWDWKGCLHKTGYAVLKFENKQIGAHQASYMIHKGKIPDGLWILHHCDVKSCTRPQHIYAGTPSRNSQDREDRKRRPIKRGIDHPNSLLDEDEVREIKKLIKMGVTLIRISDDYGISTGAIRAIKDGVTWKHID